MKRYTLQPLNGIGPPLEFVWNSDTGEVRGPDADYVRSLAADALERGVVTGYPYPTSYAITDPLRKPAEMAILLGDLWLLSEDLAGAYPQPPVDDAAGGQGD